MMLETEPLLALATVRAEMCQPAPVKQPPVMLPSRLVEAGMPMAQTVAMVQAQAPLVFQVVSLAAVDRVLQMAFVVQVVVAPVHFVVEMPLALEVVMPTVVQTAPAGETFVVPRVVAAKQRRGDTGSG